YFMPFWAQKHDDYLKLLRDLQEHCEDLWDRVEGVRHKLTRVLNPAKLTPYLRQCKVIDEQDEDEVLNSIQYPLRITKAGRLLDILRSQGPRGLQAFMESLEFYHPEQYTQLTGEEPTHRCSLILGKKKKNKGLLGACIKFAL
uniref:CARD domain-containing protein n=1 Tax=Hippocampus comes TaxID=109280 RepID=A0A3Q2XX56_HIPCM